MKRIKELIIPAGIFIAAIALHIFTLASVQI
jgi:hypothetical protein